ncbi:MAG: sulfite exporter TauE/SafE family protein [Pseudomonadota bacterium]
MLDFLYTIEFALSAAAIFVAGLARGMLGFGATLILVPCLVTIYGPIEAVVVASVIEIPAVLSLLPTAVRQADWRHIAPVALASFLTIPFGAWLLVTLDPDVARRAIAAAVILFALALATGWRYQQPPGLWVKLGVGAASGVTSGLANIGGPIVVMFLVASNKAAAGVRAGIMAYFSIGAVYRIATYAVLGMYAASIVKIAVALCVPYLIGIGIGTQLFSKVSEKLFMRIAIGLVLAAGLVAALK